MNKLDIYEKEVAPLIKQIGQICEKHGFEFQAVTALSKGEYRRSYWGDRRFIKDTQRAPRVVSDAC